MRYVLYAELNIMSAIIIGMLLVRWLYMKKGGTQNWLFTCLLSCSFLMFAVDAVWSVLESEYVQASSIWIYITNLFYYIMLAVLPYIWYLYSNELQGRLLREGGIYRVIRIFPLCVLLVMLLFNGQTQWIFYVDEYGKYQRGEYHMIQVICSNIYLAYPAVKAILCLFMGDTGKRRRHLTVLSFVVWPLGFGIAQKIFSGSPLLCMGITIALVQLFLYSISSEETRIEREYRRVLEEKNEIMKVALVSAEGANKAKSIFLHNMSHDIRTPMNAIVGFSQIAKENMEKKAVVEDCLMKIETAGQYLLELVNDILDMARIESGKMMFEEEYVDLPAFFTNLADIVRDGMEKRGLDFTVDTNIQDKSVFCDKLRVNQIMMNLLSNAMKYTKPGGKVWLEIRQLPEKKEGMATYRISIKDTGIGMSEGFQKTVFESFERETSHDTLHIEGTGLGLAITKNIVDLLGGSIKLKSELGIGSEFVVELDFRVAEAEPETPEVVVKKDRDFTGKRILLAEDNELNREIAVMLLTAVGFMVECAEDGSQAVDMLKNSDVNYYDVILMDIQMPYMNGYKATSIIRKSMNEGYRDIPIVAMTANAFEEDRKRALDSGMNAHVAKPIDIDVLLETLGNLLK